ncbi:MAG: dockerin type I domain-containing protein [Oscillospiraceae bacterium]|nr:dockerin type I domain-containing protein [Oscillospiraceae bacterium]
MKKTISLLLAAVMLFAMLPVSALADGTEATFSLTANAAAPKIGDTVAVDCYVQSVTPWDAVELQILWNPAVLRFDGFTKRLNSDDEWVLDSTALNGYPDLNDTIGRIVWASGKSCSTNGRVFTANFTVIGAGSCGLALEKSEMVFSGLDMDITCDFDESAVEGLTAAAAVSEHIHSLIAHESVEATVEAEGSSTYWSCECGRFFADAEGAVEIAENSWIIPRIPEHECLDGDDDHSCDLCGKNPENICTVSLPDGFTGQKTAESGEDYSFTANDPHCDYELKAAMNGEEVPVKKNGDGSFTVEHVSGNLTVSELSRSGRTFSVSVTGSGRNDVTAEAAAVYGTDYSFTVHEVPLYDYSFAVSVGESEYTGFFRSGSTVTVPGSALTGDVVITADRQYAGPDGNRTVTVIGSGKDDVTAEAAATEGKDYSFVLDPADGYDYAVTVTVGSEDYEPAVSGNTYTIVGAALTGNVTVSVNKSISISVEVSRYLELDGSTVYLIVARSPVTLAEGDTLAYGEQSMFAAEKYGGYAFLTISEESPEAVKSAAMEAIGLRAVAPAAVDSGEDVNATGQVDVNDAQLTYNIYNARFDSFETVSMAKLLAADVNGDGAVTVLDAAAIVNSVIGQ